MKRAMIALVAALAFAAPAIAQTPTEPAAKISVKTTVISDLIKNEAAKAALEAKLPQIADYYDQIGGMTLAEVVPMSQGALTEENLVELQAEFDKLP